MDTPDLPRTAREDDQALPSPFSNETRLCKLLNVRLTKLAYPKNESATLVDKSYLR